MPCIFIHTYTEKSCCVIKYANKFNIACTREMRYQNMLLENGRLSKKLATQNNKEKYELIKWKTLL